MKCCNHSVVAATKGWLLPFFFLIKFCLKYHSENDFMSFRFLEIWVIWFLLLHIWQWDDLWLKNILDFEMRFDYPNIMQMFAYLTNLEMNCGTFFFLTYGRWTWQQRFRDSNIASNLAKRYCWKITLYFNIAWDIIVLCPLEKKIVWDIILCKICLSCTQMISRLILIFYLEVL